MTVQDDSAYHYLMVGNHFDNTVTDVIPLPATRLRITSLHLDDGTCAFRQGLKRQSAMVSVEL